MERGDKDDVISHDAFFSDLSIHVKKESLGYYFFYKKGGEHVASQAIEWFT